MKLFKSLCSSEQDDMRLRRQTDPSYYSHPALPSIKSASLSGRRNRHNLYQRTVGGTDNEGLKLK